jgi:hypothetical protein
LSRPRAEGRARRFAHLLAPVVLLCAPALYQGIQTTRALSWPPDVDLYRDIAQAQTMTDGQLLADPFYRDQTIWYNPLVPFLVAGASRLTGLPVHTAYTRAGAYLNILAPLAFFFLVRGLFGPLAAAVATLDFLFIRDPGDPAWLSPSYSPWLYSSAFAQTLFYLTLRAYHAALASDEGPWYLATGALLGLTFLAHTAPALILGIVIASGWRLRAAAPGTAWAPILRRHALLLLVALVTAAPFLWSILFRYHLRVRNPTPLTWFGAPLAAGGAGGILALGLSAETAVAFLGLVWLILRDERRLEAGLITRWAVAAGALLVYTLLGNPSFHAGTSLPPLLPPHHFLFSLKALESVLVGYAVSGLVLEMGRRFDLTASWVVRSGAALLAGLALGVGLAFPRYQTREAFVMARRQAEKDDTRATREEAREWIRSHTRPEDVFLAADDLALLVVGSAGRKTVALDPYFSNPYVDWKRRREGRDTMVALLEEGRYLPFATLAREFGVTFVIRKKSDGVPLDGVPGLGREFGNARITIYRLGTGSAADLRPNSPGILRGTSTPVVQNQLCDSCGGLAKKG